MPLTEILDDLALGVRTLRRSLVFTTTGILTLGLAIGANTAVFTLVNALWIRPAPVLRPERLAVFYSAVPQASGSLLVRDGEPWDWFDSLNRANRAFAGVAAEAITDQMFVKLDGRAVEAVPVSDNYFRVLGVRLRGRGFSAGDDSPGAAVVVVVAHHLWQSQFGGDPQILGRVVRINDAPAAVVGIAPPGFRGPRLGDRCDVWLTRHAALRFTIWPAAVSFRMRQILLPLRLYGRLRDGVTVEQAQAEIQRDGRERTFLRTLAQCGYPAGSQASEGNDRRLAWLLGVTSFIVLLVGCVNLTSLLLARAEWRHREIATRLALGISRTRLARLLASEALLLACLGTAAAFLLARLLLILLAAFSLPTAIPIASLDLRIDWRVVIFTIVLSLLAIAICGGGPALHASRADPNRLLGGARFAVGGAVVRWRQALLILHVAFASMLLVCAVLFTRSVHNAFTLDFGFDRDRTVFALFAPNLTAYAANADYTEITYARKASDFLRLQAKLAALPGVAAVAEGGLPFRPPAREPSPAPPVEVVADGLVHRTRVAVVSGGARYCSTLGIPIVSGRDLSEADFADGAEAVAVVGEKLAHLLWGGGDAVGRRFSWGPRLPSALPRGGHQRSRWNVLVVGVARDAVRSGVRGTLEPTLYLPDAPRSEAARRPYMGIVVRTTTNARAIVPVVTALVREVFPNAASLRVTTVEQMLQKEMMSERLGAVLFGWFAAVALALGLIGMWSVVAYLVARTTHETGVRLALGAHPHQLMLQSTLRGVLPVAAGTVIGLAGAAATARLISAYMFQIGSLDGVIVGACIAVFLAGSGVASYLPTRRILGLDAAEVLRAE